MQVRLTGVLCMNGETKHVRPGDARSSRMLFSISSAGGLVVTVVECESGNGMILTLGSVFHILFLPDAEEEIHGQVGHSDKRREAKTL